jgi:hypothetical protein
VISRRSYRESPLKASGGSAGIGRHPPIRQPAGKSIRRISPRGVHFPATRQEISGNFPCRSIKNPFLF